MIRGDNHLVLDNLRDDFPDLVQWTKDHGRPVKPNGKLTYELRSLHLTMLDPLDVLPYGCGYRFNEALAAVEGLSLISGALDGPLVKRISVEGDGATSDFSVGERIRYQLEGIVQTLRNDGQSRQAYVSVWDPTYDRGTFRPCTLGMQFFWREDRLELHVAARSLDVLQAPALNFFPAAQLQASMARLVNCGVGSLEFHVGSFHLSSSNLQVLDLMHKTDVLTRPDDIPLGFGDGSEQLWSEVADRAKFVLDVGAGRIVDGVNANAFSPTEKWYLTLMRPFWIPGG
jgi:hypothetical protein